METDTYMCRNGKKLNADHVRHSKSKTGYVSEKTIYKCEDCSGCAYKNDCVKGNNSKTPLKERTKILQAAKTFLKYRQEALERILSDEGILLRINRSIQAESTLLAMARNINKLHNKIQKGRTGTLLFSVKSI